MKEELLQQQATEAAKLAEQHAAEQEKADELVALKAELASLQVIQPTSFFVCCVSSWTLAARRSSRTRIKCAIGTQ
jgi:hypothetical protein